MAKKGKEQDHRSSSKPTKLKPIAQRQPNGSLSRVKKSKPKSNQKQIHKNHIQHQHPEQSFIHEQKKINEENPQNQAQLDYHPQSRQHHINNEQFLEQNYFQNYQQQHVKQEQEIFHNNYASQSPYSSQEYNRSSQDYPLKMEIKQQQLDNIQNDGQLVLVKKSNLIQWVQSIDGYFKQVVSRIQNSRDHILQLPPLNIPPFVQNRNDEEQMQPYVKKEQFEKSQCKQQIMDQNDSMSVQVLYDALPEDQQECREICYQVYKEQMEVENGQWNKNGFDQRKENYLFKNQPEQEYQHGECEDESESEESEYEESEQKKSEQKKPKQVNGRMQSLLLKSIVQNASNSQENRESQEVHGQQRPQQLLKTEISKVMAQKKNSNGKLEQNPE